MVPLPVEFERLVVALLVGMLIGLDRERVEIRKAQQVFAGVRTFPLIALAGALPMVVLEHTGPLLVVASFFAVAAVVVAAYLRTSAGGDVGATTEMAALVTFLLGVIAGAGYLVMAGATGVGVAALLVAKPRIEAFSRALTAEEVAAVLELAVISVIILPILPNQGYGPWQVFNPFHIWSIVVLVCALSFAGFVAMRLLGVQQGLLITGLVGALVSSTAVTMTMAARARTDEPATSAAAAATVLASTIMGWRVIVLAALINGAILPRLLPVVVVMTIVGVVAVWLLSRTITTHTAPAAGTPLANPFSLTRALLFGVVYALILLSARAAQEYYGTGGMYVAAAAAALADVDAVTIAITRLGAETQSWQAPATAVTIAVVTNTLVKLGIAVIAGGSRFRRLVAGALGGMALLGTLAGAVVLLRG